MGETQGREPEGPPDAGDRPTAAAPRIGVFPARRVSRNGVFAMLNSGAGLISGIVLIPVMLKELGPSLYGLFALSMAIAAYAGLLDFGINATVTKEVAAKRALGDHDGSGPISTIASTAFFSYFVIGLAGAAVILLLALPAINIFGLSRGDALLFRQIVLILALQVGLSLPLSVWDSVLSGLQDYHIIYSISMTATIVRLVLVLVLLNAGMGVVGLVMVGLVMASVAWLGGYIFARRRLRGLRIRPSSFDRREVGRLVKFSGSMVVWSLAGFSLNSGDRLILGLNQGLSGVAQYDIGARVSLYSRAIVQGWLDTLLPHASDLHANSARSSLSRSFLQGTRSILAVYGLVAVCLFVVGGRFFEWWIGPQYGDTSTVLLVLVAANLFQMQNLVGHVMLVGMGRIRVFTMVMAGYPPLVFLLGWFATVQFGIRGMAAAILVTVVVLESAFMPFILREFSVPFREMLRLCQVPVLSGLAGGAVLGSLVLGALDGATLPVLVLGSLATAIGYAMGYLVAAPIDGKLHWLVGIGRRYVGGR